MFQNNQTEWYHKVPTPTPSPAFNLTVIEEMEWISVVAGLPILFAGLDMSIYLSQVECNGDDGEVGSNVFLWHKKRSGKVGNHLLV